MDPYNLPPGWPTLREAARRLADQRARESARVVRRVQGEIRARLTADPANAKRARARLDAWAEGVFDTSEDAMRGAGPGGRNSALFAEGLRLFRLAAVNVEGFGPLLEAERVRRFLGAEGKDAGLLTREIETTIRSAERRARAEGAADLPRIVAEILRGDA